jgi:hypothetical protein
MENATITRFKLGVSLEPIFEDLEDIKKPVSWVPGGTQMAFNFTGSREDVPKPLRTSPEAFSSRKNPPSKAIAYVTTYLKGFLKCCCGFDTEASHMTFLRGSL